MEDILQRGVAEGEPEKAEAFMQSIYNFESKKNSKKSVWAFVHPKGDDRDPNEEAVQAGYEEALQRIRNEVKQ